MYNTPKERTKKKKKAHDKLGLLFYVVNRGNAFEKLFLLSQKNNTEHSVNRYCISICKCSSCYNIHM